MKYILAMAMILFPVLSEARILAISPLISTAQTVTNAWANVGSGLPIYDAESLSYAVSYTAGDATGIKLRAIGRPKLGGVSTYLVPLKIVGESSTALGNTGFYLPAASTNMFVELAGGTPNTVPFVQLQIMSDGGSTATIDTAVAIKADSQK